MAYWTSPKRHQMFNLKGVDENDVMMGVMLSQKPGNDLIQNCDLPPPTKVFSGLYDNATIIGDRKKLQDFVYDHEKDGTDDGDKKIGVLKALRLSQTRAREAEAKYAAIIKERDALAVAFMQDSMQIFAYRQFVRLLEFRVSQLQLQSNGKRKQVEEEDDDDDSGSDGLTWLITVAFCLGIAGVGLAIGCKCFFC